MTITCACPYCTESTSLQRAARRWTRIEGEWYCPDCADYSITPAGDVLCAYHDLDGGYRCPDCGQSIDWGPVQTGTRPNRIYGRCGCSGRRWLKEDRGGWTTPTYEDEDA